MRNKIFALLLTLVLLCSIPLTAHAAEIPDPDRLGSITLTMTYDGKPIPGGSLTLYRVADVVSDNGDYFFTYTADFAGCSIPVTELDSTALPVELKDIAEDQKLTGITQTADSDGVIRFQDLKIGLYLLVQDQAAPGFKRVNPFLVSVPYNNDGTYIYDVDTAPKNLPGPEVEQTEPTEPSTEPTEPDKELPQTGQTNWPIPVMAVAGLLMVLLGICCCLTGRKKSHEA